MTDTDINKAVAEKVFGYPPSYFCKGTGKEDHDERHCDRPRHYSSDPTASRMVIERMRELGWNVLVNFYKDAVQVFIDKAPYEKEYEAKNKIADRAICLAALEAIDGDT